MMRFIAYAVTAFSLVSPDVSNVLPDQHARAVRPPTPTGSPGGSCAQTPIVVPNGGFESGSLSPWVQDLQPVPSGAPSTLKIIECGYNSSHALQMSLGYSAEIHQTNIPTCEATIYIVSFAYKIVNATATCRITATASTTPYNSYSRTINPLLPGGWSIATFNYHSTVALPYSLSFKLVCPYEESSATILLDDIQIKTSCSLASNGCPKSIGWTNGGFDNGQFAPRTATRESGNFGNPPQYMVISPGYQSPYALQLDFAETNFTDWFFQQNFPNLCDWYQYNVSFALNWVNYTGPASNGNNGCTLLVLEQRCAGGPTDGHYYASSNSGWQEYSYMCLANKNKKGSIDVQMECTDAEPIPAFAVQLDNFNIQLRPTPSSGGSSTPPPNRRMPTTTPTNAAALRRVHRNDGRANPQWA
jgi:hypothetical protein